MHTMKRNQRPFYYCLYDHTEQITDEDGNETGEARVIYKVAVPMSASISPAYGNAQIELFGVSEGYDKVILVDDTSCPIDENTVLFVDKSPEVDEAGNPLYDYIVKRVARSLNVVAYGLRKVKVS